MTIAQYLRLLREQWITVLLLTVLGALGAGVYSFLQTPMYQASTQLFVSVSSSTENIGELTQGGTFTQQRVKSYTDLLTSPRVLDPVISDLALPTNARELASRVTATSPLDTVLIDVTVTDSSPTRAADIANAIGTQFPTFVSRLETPAGQAVSPVQVRATRSAVAPSAPVSPRTTLNLALGLLVGLGLGVGAAVLRDSLDRTIGGRSQASHLANAPVLGAVADDSQVTQTPLISHDAFSARAEAFRQLRTNIRFLSIDRQVSSLVVTGSVQGEGKTTTAANIAIALAQSGERVVLIDADLRRPAIADLFGVPSGIGLTTVLLGDSGVDTALQRWRDDLPLFLLPAGPLPPNPSELIGSARMAELVHHLTGHGMTVVVDSPPLLPVTDAAILARVTDGALIVTRVASTKIDQFSAAIESLRTAGAPVLGVVLNRVPRRGRSSSGSYDSYNSRYHNYPPAPAGRSGDVPAAAPAPVALPGGSAVGAPSVGAPSGGVTSGGVPAGLPGVVPAHAGPGVPASLPGAVPGPVPGVLPGAVRAAADGMTAEAVTATPMSADPMSADPMSGGVAGGGRLLGDPAPGDLLLGDRSAPTLLPTGRDAAAGPFPGGAGGPDFVDLRPTVGAGPMTVPVGVGSSRGHGHHVANGVNGSVNGVNGTLNGAAHDALSGFVNGRPSPYDGEQQSTGRLRGRRSAAPPEEG